MKTRAYDCDERRWRTDYVVMPDGSLWRYVFGVFSGNRLVEKVDWKLSRFTGHIDINKNEIYENHILKLASGSTGVVEFRDGSFIVDIKKESGEFEFYEWPNEYFLKYDYDDGFINAKHFEYVGYEKGVELGTLKTIAYYENVSFNITAEELEFFEDQQQKLSNVLNESPVDISFPIAMGIDYDT